jgi:5-methylcytosine-specific restriction endonuclease McrA
LSVFVLDKRKRPLMPCSEKRARLLLERGRAVVHRRYPFTIRLKDRVVGEVQPIRVKLDPGSKTTGIAVVTDEDRNKPTRVLCLFELTHRGRQISEALTARRAFRRRRRGANLRYRAPRFDNRTRPQGWLPPSLQHRVETCMSWVGRFSRLAPVAGIAVERVRFDMQLLENPEISGVEYQQGTLAGYERREYVFEKFGRHCVYCGAVDVPLNLDHVVPRSRGGSNRVSNLVPACIPCNTEKDAKPVEEFLAGHPALLARIKAQAKAPLKDAAAVNATRWALYEALADTGLPIEASSGGRTKYNRSRLGIPKSHALDAACVGEVGTLVGWQIPSTEIKATGRGDYCRTNLDRHGFSRGYYTRAKRVRGFQTGDMVRAEVPKGARKGVHVGRVAVRVTGSFRVGNADGINAKYCKLLHRADGYSYARASSPAERPLRLEHPRGGSGDPKTQSLEWAAAQSAVPNLDAPVGKGKGGHAFVSHPEARKRMERTVRLAIA